MVVAFPPPTPSLLRGKAAATPSIGARRTQSKRLLRVTGKSSFPLVFVDYILAAA